MNLSFDSVVRLDQVRSGERLELNATTDQLAAIAKRLGLAGIERLDAHVILDRKDDIVRASGRLRARLTQECVVTREPIATHIDESFDILFTPETPEVGPDSEIELGPEDCDTIFYDGQAFALGEAIADTLALSIDPYPRSAAADVALKEAGVMSEAEAGPFSALAALKGKLEDRS